MTLGPSELFQRNLMYDEFDVFEMSISETLLALERSDGSKWDWVAQGLLTQSLKIEDIYYRTTLMT